MKSKILPSLLFLILVSFGTFLSIQKPLWTDELHTQINTIDKLSFEDILLLEFFPEANKCPLFYLVQDALSSALNYHFPISWNKQMNIGHIPSQIILRIPSNVYMSLALVLIFCYFHKTYSLSKAWLALVVALISPMVWEHWVEARPYSLWFLLTVIQLKIFLSMLAKEKLEKRDWIRLAVIHFTLAFTVIFSMIQIVIVSFVLWIYRDKKILKYLTLTVIPSAISAGYFLISRNMFTWRETEVHSSSDWGNTVSVFFKDMPNVFLCYSVEFLILFLFFAAVVCCSKQKNTLENKKFLMWMAFFILATELFFLFYAHTTSMNQPTPSRYFMYMVPVGIFSTTIVLHHLIYWSRTEKWLFLNTMMIIFGIVGLRAVKTFIHVYMLGIY